MTKIAQMDIPPGYEELLAKITAWFESLVYPTWATRFRHGTRSAKKANKEKTYLPSVRDAWALLSPATKALWKSCNAFAKQSGYLYFTTKYSYNKKNGLDLAITPTSLHQLYGLKMSDPAGDEIVQATRDDIVLLGAITIAFTYKKTEVSEAPIDPFYLYVEAWYFEAGENKKDEYLWEAPAGNVDWTAVQFSFGTTGRNYFHVVCSFVLFYYDADVFLDNFLITDQLGDVYREPWKKLSGKEWVYTKHYRKAGWEFYPEYWVPWFEVQYLE
jgi:hypothetical protein